MTSHAHELNETVTSDLPDISASEHEAVQNLALPGGVSAEDDDIALSGDQEDLDFGLEEPEAEFLEMSPQAGAPDLERVVSIDGLHEAVQQQRVVDGGPAGVCDASEDGAEARTDSERNDEDSIWDESHSDGITISDDPFEQYRREIARYPLLPANIADRKVQESELAKRIEAGRKATESLDASGYSPDPQLRENIQLAESDLAQTLGREPTTSEVMLAAKQTGAIDGLSEEQIEMIRSVNDAAKAEQRFIEANLRLVVHRAQNVRPANMEVMDRVQAGNIGLVRAVRTFDYTRGCTFSTYARPVIDDAIRKASMKEGDGLGLSKNDHERIVTVLLEQRRLESQGNSATAADIAASLEKRDLAFDFTEESVTDLIGARAMSKTPSLNKPETGIDGGEDGAEFGDHYALDTSPGPEAAAENNDLTHQLHTFLTEPPEGFPPLQARALSLRFFGGPVKGELMDYADIAKVMNLSTVQGARNHVNKALNRLGDFANDPRLAGLRDYH